MDNFKKIGKLKEVCKLLEETKQNVGTMLFGYEIEEFGKIKNFIQQAIEKVNESAGRIAMETYKEKK